jgi:hypothetical protein
MIVRRLRRGTSKGCAITSSTLNVFARLSPLG